MMPLPPRVTVMVERQLNDVELRHDPERVRVASVFDGFARLVVLPPCLFVALPSYSLSSVHYPPFVRLYRLYRLYRYWFRRTRVLVESSTLFFSHSFRILFASVHSVVCFSDDSFVLFCPTIVQLFLCPGFYSQFVPIYTHFYLSRCPSRVAGLSIQLSRGTMIFDSCFDSCSICHFDLPVTSLANRPFIDRSV